MANAKKCDFCGEFYEYYKSPFVSNADNATSIRFYCGDVNIVKEVDLCPDCLKKFLCTLEAFIPNAKSVINR